MLIFAHRGASGWNEAYVQNICVLYKLSMPYVIGNCDTADLFVPYLANNTIYTPNGIDVNITCVVDGKSTQLGLGQWQSYGVDMGTTVHSTPDVQTVIEWGREMLQATVD